MIAQVDVFATWVYTIPDPPEKYRKLVIKTFSIREGWWYIGIKGDGGVKSKGTRLLIPCSLAFYLYNYEGFKKFNRFDLLAVKK